MKKNYIRPESKLFTINLNENIAQSFSGGNQSGISGTTGGFDYVLYDNGEIVFANKFHYVLTDGDKMAALGQAMNDHGAGLIACLTGFY